MLLANRGQDCLVHLWRLGARVAGAGGLAVREQELELEGDVPWAVSGLLLHRRAVRLNSRLVASACRASDPASAAVLLWDPNIWTEVAEGSATGSGPSPLAQGAS